MAERGVDTLTFDFPYMRAGRKVPDTGPVLEDALREAIAACRGYAGLENNALVIGGKSMGGRIASQVAAGPEAVGSLAGLVFLGYPLHPPGRPDQRRDRHLPRIGAPMLFVQGSRDAFGTPDELRPVLATLTAPADLLVVEGGDHSFTVSRNAATQGAVMQKLYGDVSGWIAVR
jgi:predicted alpha/beta-hydrolase family hydrolase